MPVKIIQNNSNQFCITPEDFVDGHAYESEQGIIYIANKVHLDCIIYAFSICGNYYIAKGEEHKNFREVNLTITVG